MQVSVRRGLAVAVAALTLLSCSDSDSSDSTTTSSAAPIPEGQAPVRVEEIDEAIAAVETALGGPQQYFEVNATPTLVNLFVATDSVLKAVAYVYAAGGLQEPAPPETAGGPTFAATGIDFDPALVLSRVVAELPDSTVRAFSVLGTEGGGVRYLVTVDSPQGGQLAVLVGSNGEILGTAQG